MKTKYEQIFKYKEVNRDFQRWKKWSLRRNISEVLFKNEVLKSFLYKIQDVLNLSVDGVKSYRIFHRLVHGPNEKDLM